MKGQRASLAIHMQYRRNAKDRAQSTDDSAARRYVDILRDAGVEPYEVDGWSCDKRVNRAVQALNPSSSPGFPLMYYYNTNAELLASHDGVRMLKEMVHARIAGKAKLSYVRIFIKREPHKLAKVSEGRFRIISSVSAQDQVYERLLFSYLDDLELRHHKALPVKVGFTGLGDFAETLNYAAKDAGPDDELGSIDFQAYDWTKAIRRLYRAHAIVRKDMATALDPDELDKFRAAIDKWYQSLQEVILMLADGKLVDLVVEGLDAIQLSGRFSTLSDNSREQALMYLMCFPHATRVPQADMGDDSLTRFGPGERLAYVSFLEKLGLRVKQVSVQSASSAVGVEWCSRKLQQDGSVIFTSRGRQWWRLLNISWPKQDAQAFLSACDNFAGHEQDWRLVSHLFERITGYPPAKRDYFLRRMVGENSRN